MGSASESEEKFACERDSIAIHTGTPIFLSKKDLPDFV